MYLELVTIMQGNLPVQSKEDETIRTELIKVSDKILIRFSKDPLAWEVVFEVLKIGQGVYNGIQLQDSHLFLSANMFKNKVKIDFVTLKGDGT